MDGSPNIAIEVALLKQRSDQADQRMERVENKLDRLADKLDSISDRISGLATKTTVWSALGTGAALSFAVVAIFVGVLPYLQDQRVALRPEPARRPHPRPSFSSFRPGPPRRCPPAPAASPG